MEVDDKQIKIKAVYDKYTKEQLDANEFQVKLIDQGDSSIYRIFKGEDVVTKNNSLICEYECMNCQRLNVVSLNNISQKLNRQTLLKCQTCIEKGLGLLNRLQDDEKQFDEMDDDFKRSYFRKNLDRAEFDHLKTRILSIQNGKFETMGDFIYFPCVKVANQSRFSPYLYDMTRDALEKIQYIHLKCDCCSKTFLSRDIFKQKNKLKILCDDCGFTNNVIKFRNQFNMLGCRVQYRSKLEKKLIDWANGNSVVIENGPVLSGDIKIGLQLPKLHVILECGSNQELKNGNWKAKASAAEAYVKDESNEYTKFLMIFPKDFVEKTNYLLNYLKAKVANKI